MNPQISYPLMSSFLDSPDTATRTEFFAAAALNHIRSSISIRSPIEHLEATALTLRLLMRQLETLRDTTKEGDGLASDVFEAMCKLERGVGLLKDSEQLLVGININKLCVADRGKVTMAPPPTEGTAEGSSATPPGSRAARSHSGRERAGKGKHKSSIARREDSGSDTESEDGYYS